jgi:hypothetical protein
MTKPSLAETHPEIAAQAHGWDPSTVTFGSETRREWKCGLEHLWSASPNARTSGKVHVSGCPFCSGRRAWPGFNDLVTTHPKVATQAHGWDPTTATASSHKIVEWMCGVEHVWSSQVKDRTRESPDGCPFCSGRRVLAGFNDLATVNPPLAAQSHGWDPTTVTFCSGRKVEWACELGHIYSATVANRRNGDNCPYCSGHKVLVGFNDLATLYPEIAGQAHGWDPTTVTRRSRKRLEWECSLGHTWFARPDNRTKPNGTGCPGCYNMTYDEMTRSPLKFRDEQRKHT